MKKASQNDMDDLNAALASLEAAVGGSLERANKVRDCLFSGGEQLSPGFIELCCVPTGGANGFSLRFKVTDKFREFMTALAAGEFDGQTI